MKVLIFLTLLIAAAYADHCGAATGWKWFFPKWDDDQKDYDWSLNINAQAQAQNDQWCETNCEHSSQLHPACFVGVTSDAGVNVHHRCFCGETEGSQGTCPGNTGHGSGSGSGTGSTAGDCPADSWRWYEPGWVTSASGWVYDWQSRATLDNWCETTCRHTSQLAPACLLQTHEGQNVNIHHRCFCEFVETGLHFVFVLDESASMSIKTGVLVGPKRWDAALAGIQAFITARTPTATANNDILTIITYDHDARTQFSRIPFAGFNVNQLASRSNGLTQHYEGLNEFIANFPNPAAETKQIVLFFISDGGGSQPTTSVNNILSNTALFNLIHSVYVTNVGLLSSTSALTYIATQLGGAYQGYTTTANFNSYYTGLASSIVL